MLPFEEYRTTLKMLFLKRIDPQRNIVKKTDSL